MRTRQTVNVLAGALALHLLYRLVGSHTTTSIVVDTGTAQVVYDEHSAAHIPHKLLHPLEKPQQVALEQDPDSEVGYDPAPELSKPSKGKSKATEDEELDPVTLAFGHISVDLAHAPVLPSTELLSHADGWTVMRDVYMSNGTFYLIVNSTARKDWPNFRFITSTGLPGFNTPENIAAREPTAQEIAFITHDEAMARWGPSKIFSRNAVTTVHGNTILYNDPPQFLDHYYHFVAELLFGTWAAWRGTFASALSVLDSANRPSNADTLITSDADPRALPHRVIFAHSPGGSAKLAGDQKSSLRDKFGLNTLFLRSAFPSVDLEDEQAWMERSAQTSHGNSAWHFPNLMLVDRSASFRGPITGECHRTAAAAYYPHTRSGALKADWWEPVRSAILNHITPALPVDDKQVPFPEPHFGFPGPKGWTTPSRIPLVRDDMRLQTGMEGGARRMRAENKFDASAWETSEKAEHALRVRAAGLESQGVHAAAAKADDDKVVITYISRQKSRRRLTESDHDALVLALQEMSDRRGFKLNIVLAEKLTASAQLALAARTTILLGVHGNGLTHLLMMPPRARSTVIEIFYPEGFAHDYEWTTRSLGMKHFGVWNDTSITWPELPWVAYPNGFQGMDIPVHPPNIIKIIEGRVDGTL